MKDGFIFRGYKKMEKTLFKKNTIASNIKPEWLELCEECSTAAKKHNLTKEKSRKLLQEIRETYNL